ncbi:histidine phosphatase family protein [Panacibacter sp. DH6]|uniref:Histidine phosphatase family protein n=1 Tax=Panacibacter microcysteis TaxID=2793269 RepID=A0A931GU93_9BACT|nr:histidine phosphatase family protein [Panacibacter microcysteis]MBG9375145.1 histidine phosphatase family protein [Panacibacter microcysteis]
MKTLLLVRHAKSSWDNPSQKDFDRPLNNRGNKDAPAMAEKLAEKGVIPDALVSSTAVRALSTAKYFAKAFNYPGQNIIKTPALYEAPYDVYFDVISKFNNQFQSVAIFAHNPGITMFANKLTNTQIDNMPTCCVFAVQVETDNWSNFEQAKKTFWFIDYPKNGD